MGWRVGIGWGGWRVRDRVGRVEGRGWRVGVGDGGWG